MGTREQVMRHILAGIFCIAAVLGQISTASAGGYYYYGSLAGICCALQPMDLGWAYTRNQPVSDSPPYPAVLMPDGSLGCEHSNYRPIRGWCRRIW